MTENFAETDFLRCPTCGARQNASPECRRCKCDLSLVVEMRNEARRLHRTCLVHLVRGNHRLALHYALKRCDVAPDPTARRLLAVVYLIRGQFRAALDVRDSEPAVIR